MSEAEVIKQVNQGDAPVQTGAEQRDGAIGDVVRAMNQGNSQPWARPQESPDSSRTHIDIPPLSAMGDLFGPSSSRASLSARDQNVAPGEKGNSVPDSKGLSNLDDLNGRHPEAPVKIEEKSPKDDSDKSAIPLNMAERVADFLSRPSENIKMPNLDGPKQESGSRTSGADKAADGQEESSERSAETKRAQEVAATNLKPALEALAKGDMAKLSEIAASLKNDDNALGQLQKMIAKKTGVGVNFGGSGVEITVSKQFPEAAPGTIVADGITQSTSVKFDKAGKPVSAEQTVSGGYAGGSKTKEMDPAEAHKVVQEALTKSLKDKK